MSPEVVGLVGTGIMLLLIFLAVPVAVSMILVGVVGLTIIVGPDRALGLVEFNIVSPITDYSLAVLPVFLLMGEFADISGMMAAAYKSTNTWLGNIPGGLAMASILGAAAFSAVSGSSMACAAIMARVALPQLMKNKYDPALATGALAAGGTLGNLIPPGILLIFYAIMSETSLGQLFTACVLPGALLVAMYLIQVFIQCKLNPALGPRAGATTWKEKLESTTGLAPILVVFTLVLGGIWFGIYTPNEAASFGTAFVFIYAVIRKTIKGQTLIQSFKNTIITTGMAFAVIIGAKIFSAFVAFCNVPEALTSLLQAFQFSALGVVILMMVIYFILGLPLSALTMMFLTLPVFVPVLNAYHIDLIWFGVLLVVQLELANLTPPVGLNLFVVAAIAKPFGISMGTVFRGAWPFVATMLVFNAILIAFPQIALYLVSQMKTFG